MRPRRPLPPRSRRSPSDPSSTLTPSRCSASPSLPSHSASAEQTTAVATLDGALASPALQTANHAFLIGGAELYALALSPPSPSSSSTSSSSSSPAPPPAPAAPLVDRILLTRILSPSFECDAHLAEFRASGLWVQAPAGALGRWVGWDVDDEIVQEEKGVRYAFEMWVRKDAGGAEASG